MQVYCEEMFPLQPSLAPEIMEYSALQPVVHPALIGMSSIEQQASLNAGFRDCANEAIRYLIEEEDFSADDPLVVGLKEHLKEQQRLYSLQQMFRQYNYMYGACDSEHLDDSGISISSHTDHDSGTSSDTRDVVTDINVCITDNSLETDLKEESETKSDSHAHHEHSNVLDINVIASLAHEILSLLEDGVSLSDMDDDEDYAVEQ